MSVNTKISESFLKFGKSVLNLAEVIKKTPGILSYFVAGEKKDLHNIPKLNNKNFKFYVGETKKYEKDQFYSEEFYIGAIANLIDLLEKDGTLDIEVGADVSKIMNENGEVTNSMTTQEQIEFIREIIRKNFKKFESKINLINTSKRHPELFNELEKKGLDGLESNIASLELGDNFKSLDIAKLLYKACKKDEKIFNIIKGTRPEKVKESDSEKPKYYSLVEIAFRLTDYINGITIQGGERRQERYDIIIRAIINGDFNNIPSIKKIYDFLQTKQNLGIFDSLHFNKKAFEKELEKIGKIKRIGKLIGAISLAVSIILGLHTAGIHLNKQKQTEDLNNRKKTLISQALEKTSLTQYYGLLGFQEYTTDDQKYERINDLGSKLANLFIQKYGKGNIMGEELQLFFISKMIENNKYSFNKIDYGDTDFLKFIDEILEKPINKATLVSFGFNVDNNYGEYATYKEDFLNTYKSDIELDLDKSEVKKIGEYIARDGNPSDIALYKKDGKRYIVARNYSNGKYSFEKARVVSLDFLGTPFNHFSILLINTGNSLGIGFSHFEEKIIKLLVDKVISGESNIRDIKNWNLIDKINFLYKNFPDKFGFDLKEVLNDTINMPQEIVDEIIQNKKKIFFTKVGMYKFDKKSNTEYSIFIYEFKNKKYIISDLGDSNNGELLKLYGSKYNIEGGKEFASKLSKLL
ncbi:MAG: hypothetical protein WC850_01495 [Candidatus Gracilibacteria bacterium]